MIIATHKSQACLHFNPPAGLSSFVQSSSHDRTKIESLCVLCASAVNLKLSFGCVSSEAGGEIKQR